MGNGGKGSKNMCVLLSVCQADSALQIIDLLRIYDAKQVFVTRIDDCRKKIFLGDCENKPKS